MSPTEKNVVNTILEQAIAGTPVLSLMRLEMQLDSSIVSVLISNN